MTLLLGGPMETNNCSGSELRTKKDPPARAAGGSDSEVVRASTKDSAKRSLNLFLVHQHRSESEGCNGDVHQPDMNPERYLVHWLYSR